ncbi:MAG: hypothetical protein JWQ03_107 [Variovorax sp.]|nr:hypothetical protein [Variovorax sp.]
MVQTVVGVFDSASDAENARVELVRAGFRDSDVHVQSHSNYLADNGGSAATTTTTTRDTESDTGEGFMANVGHFFSNLFGGDEQAGHYSEAVRRGGTVVSVTVTDESSVDSARTALASAGAVDIEKRAEAWRQEGYSSFDASAKPYTSEQVEAERGKVLPVVREQLEVGKREVDLGAVRVHVRTEEKPVEETVELREQRAAIERRPVDRPATEADLAAFRDGTIEVKETAERAVVNKTARVVEEVVVGTQSSSSSKTVSDTVRNTVVEVDKTGAAGGGATDDRSSLYRSHYDSNFATQGGRYEDYEPAYQYGSSLRSDSRYANRSWDEVEADAQRDWSTRYPGSSWDRFKLAVRQGWDSMTGKNDGFSRLPGSRELP